ncbi:MAG: hypothetical protein IJ253_02330 [Bacteroidaceae bacterium]|nr:hypothetical protein [Bacteroidaceae bacterium]
MRLMYVEVTRGLEVNLMGMSIEEACALAAMIENAGTKERRIFNQVLKQLRAVKDCGMT